MLCNAQNSWISSHSHPYLFSHQITYPCISMSPCLWFYFVFLGLKLYFRICQCGESLLNCDWPCVLAISTPTTLTLSLWPFTPESRKSRHSPLKYLFSSRWEGTKFSQLEYKKFIVEKCCFLYQRGRITRAFYLVLSWIWTCYPEWQCPFLKA